jgi:hypothetical protein
MAWQTPKTNWGQAGQTVPIADDFNRIEGNIQELQNTKETPAGAQAKANTAEANAKAYTDAHEQKAAPHSGHETPAGAQAKAEAAAGVVQAELDAHKSDYATINNLGHIKHGEFDETIYADNWTGAEPPFTNEVSLAAITGTDVPIIDVRMTGTFATDTAIHEGWGYIYRAVTATGKITFYATEKPEINLPIHVKVVR